MSFNTIGSPFKPQGVFVDSRSYGRVLCEACSFGDLEQVTLMLNSGARPNDSLSFPGYTPLYFACKGGHDTVVAELISRGADVSYKDPHTGLNPLAHSVISGSIKCCELLIKAGADVNEVFIGGKTTPLILACSLRKYEIVKLFLDSGAEVNKSFETETPLTMALRNHYPVNHDLVQLLIDRKVDVNQLIPGGILPLCLAAYTSDVESVKILLEAGANPHLSFGNDNSPLKYAQQLLASNQAMTGNILSLSPLFIDKLEEIVQLLGGK